MSLNRIPFVYVYRFAFFFWFGSVRFSLPFFTSIANSLSSSAITYNYTLLQQNACFLPFVTGLSWRSRSYVCGRLLYVSWKSRTKHFPSSSNALDRRQNNACSHREMRYSLYSTAMCVLYVYLCLFGDWHRCE